jgi:hypothetical protein
MGHGLFLASFCLRFVSLPKVIIGRRTVARPASVFVSDLSDEDRNWLIETWKTHRMHSKRARALAALLSSQGRTIIEIATALMVDEDTARCWINRWFIGRMFISIATFSEFLLRKKLRWVFCNRVFYEVARLLDFRSA